MNIIAGGFYDGVMLYAHALNETVSEARSRPSGRLVNARMRNRTFYGGFFVSGNMLETTCMEATSVSVSIPQYRPGTINSVSVTHVSEPQSSSIHTSIWRQIVVAWNCNNCWLQQFWMVCQECFPVCFRFLDKRRVNSLCVWFPSFENFIVQPVSEAFSVQERSECSVISAGRKSLVCSQDCTQTWIHHLDRTSTDGVKATVENDGTMLTS